MEPTDNPPLCRYFGGDGKEGNTMSRRYFRNTEHEASARSRTGTVGNVHSPYIILFLQFYVGGDQWFGDCEALGIMSCGHTLDEARGSLNSLIDITLGSWSDDGELERLLEEKTLQVYSGSLEQSTMEYPVLPPNHLLEMHLQPVLA